MDRRNDSFEPRREQFVVLLLALVGRGRGQGAEKERHIVAEDVDLDFQPVNLGVEHGRIDFSRRDVVDFDCVGKGHGQFSWRRMGNRQKAE